jgi:hypothetical protein
MISLLTITLTIV